MLIAEGLAKAGGLTYVGFYLSGACALSLAALLLLKPKPKS